MRKNDRALNALRPVEIERDVSQHAEGSCLISFGATKILCTASVEDRVPPFLRNTGRGWVTAEYGMLPRSTQNRLDRKRMIDDGRVKEIQRLIGRSLRSVTNLKGFGERQVRIDCDVIDADGGTRTAAITGGFIALYDAFRMMEKTRLISEIPLNGFLSAISCGVLKGKAFLDLDYEEDSSADVDANFVMNDKQQLIELQATAEQAPFSRDEMNQLLDIATEGTQQLIELQKKALDL